MRESERERERDSGWERVIPKREWRERERVRDRKEPCLNIVGQRIGDQQRYMRANWRDHRNISSFYFTCFSEDTTEEELWQHFKKADDVREIFISKKRNMNRRRYDFVRFIGVDNVQ